MGLTDFKAVRIFLFAALAVSLAGCSSVGGSVTYKPLVRAKGKVLFVPFRSERGYYYDDEGGTVIAAAAAAELERNSPDAVALDSSASMHLVRALAVNEKVTPSDWASLGSEVGADWVVFGSVGEISWQDKMDPSVPRCNFTVTYEVIQVARKRAVLGRTVSGVYPYQAVADEGISVFEMGPDMLQFRSYAYIGRVVARTFFAHRLPLLEHRSLIEGQ